MKLSGLVSRLCVLQAVNCLPFNLNFNVNTNVNLNLELEEQQAAAAAIALTPQVAAEADRTSLLTLHKNLIEQASISQQEQNVSGYLADHLRNLGLTVELIPSAADGRDNIYAYLGKTRDTKVLYTSHIDTVPPYIDYYFEGDRIYGRGSCDAKGSVAAQITAFLELLSEGKINEGDVALLYVVGEEIGGDGMADVDASIDAKWDTVIFGEPTENKLAVGHKGIFLFDIKTHGVSSHSGYPELGVNANDILIKLMYDLSTAEWPEDEVLGPTTINIGLINAGTAANVISPVGECSVVMRLSVPVAEIAGKVDSIVSKYDHVEVNFRQNSDPVFLDYEFPGFDTMIAAYSTDIPNLAQKGFKRYLYGPGSILVAHGDHEYVTIDSLLTAVDDYKTLALGSIN